MLLQIGSYTLTVADYEFAANSPPYKSLTHEQLQNRLVEEGRMLAYALDHQFDTMGMLKLQLEYAMRYYASKVDGYVWTKKVKPVLKVTEEDIREAYKMRSGEYQLEFIHFSNEGLLKKYNAAGRPVPSARAFYDLKEKTGADPNVGFHSGIHRYPFFPLGVYIHELSRARVGDVWGPVETLSGYYVVHVANKRSVAPGAYEQERPAIREELLLGLQEKYIWHSQRQILRETQPRLHEDAIAEMAAKVNVQERKWPGVPPGMVLMEYDFGGTHRNYTAADFIEFVQCQPMFAGSLSDPGDVKKMLHGYLIGISLYEQGLQMNMEKDPAYQLLKKRYQHNIFIRHYKQQHIYPRLSIGEVELERYYRQHQQQFTCFAQATVSMQLYPDMPGAFAGRKLLMDQLKTGMPAETTEVRVNDTVYSKAVIDAIAELRPGVVSMPIQENGQCRIIYLLSKSGSVVMPYKYARETIRQLLFSKKEKELMAMLDKEYPVGVNHLKEHQAK